MNMIKEQSDERDAQGKVWRKVLELSCLLHIYPSFQIPKYSPTQKFSEPHPFGFFWRLHYIGMFD